PASRASPKNASAPSPPPPQPEAEPPAKPPARNPTPPPVRTMTIPDEEPIKPASFNDGNDDDFDFGNLTNFGPNDTDMQDTDGISSLLPGLESYANSGGGNGATESNSQSISADFDIFDAAGAGDFSSAPKVDAKSAAQGQPDMGNRDDTFDDIMNFTEFDMGDFSGGAGDEGGESKFDASFFDI
ncbi:hypothetical protein E4T45_13681, partial [Aureobasidium sp. EXF-8846]